MKGKKLPDTTLSRAIIIEMKRKKADETKEDFNHVDDDELSTLRRKLLRWANDNAERLGAARPEKIPGFDNRTWMNYRMLLAIAELAGEEAKQKAWVAAEAIEGNKHLDEESIGIRLLADIRDIFDANGESGILSKALTGALNNDPEKPWAEYRRGNPLTQRQLAALLGQFGIRSEEIHPANGRHGKGYKRVRFEESWERYLSAQTRESA